MENRTTVILAVLITAVVCTAGCVTVLGTDSESEQSITVTGSTTIQPLMNGFQEEFQPYSDMTLNITGGGSGVGISSVQNGSADIGMSSRDLKSTEAGLTVTAIAKDGVVIIVEKSANIVNLTMEQLAGIYSGKYTNWSELGGADKKINPVIREEGSGTRTTFDDILISKVSGFNTSEYSGFSTQASTGAMLSQVQMTAGAIGYVNLGSMDELGGKINAVTLDGIMPSDSTVSDGTYEMSRSLWLVTKGEPTGAAGFFINWILSAQGQEIVSEYGFVKV